MLGNNKQYLSLDNQTILVTGGAGFIGANLILRLLEDTENAMIINIDNMNDYYDPSLKEYRLTLINDATEKSSSSHILIKGSIADRNLIDKTFEKYRPDIVVNMAAQAGVRYSIDHPDTYIESNILGFYNILEASRRNTIKHLIYASSSSVYGGNAKVPFREDDNVDHPVSLYAATKKTDELLSYSYSKLYDIPSTGLRFFTVYGPAGRPDMFYFSATEKMVAGNKIQIFNYGDMKRDFTYIDDIVEGIIRVMQGAPKKETGKDGLPIAPYSLYNIGGSRPESLLEFVTVLQEELVAARVLPVDYDFESHKELVGMQAGDVPVTYASVVALEKDFGFRPYVNIRQGLRLFSNWYKEYYS